LVLKEIKKEIRVLGLSACKMHSHFILIGVIYRGSKWLDGVVIGKTTKKTLTQSLIKMITESKYFQQIRIIFFHPDLFPKNSIIDLNELFENTSKPIIFISNNNIYGFNKCKHLYFQEIGINTKKAKEILLKTVKNEKLPEVLNIAKLIKNEFKSGTYNKL
jgi:endonuclease V-like protein UPF0215 family